MTWAESPDPKTVASAEDRRRYANTVPRMLLTLMRMSRGRALASCASDLVFPHAIVA